MNQFTTKKVGHLLQIQEERFFIHNSTFASIEYLPISIFDLGKKSLLTKICVGYWEQKVLMGFAYL